MLSDFKISKRAGMDRGNQDKMHLLRMSPLTRLCMVFSEDLKRDKTGLLIGLKDKYVERVAISEQKWHRLFRSLFLIDAALAFLITGHDFKIPLLDIRAIEIPAVVEAATIASAFAAATLVSQFVSWASYDMILRQFSNSTAGAQHSDEEQRGQHRIDPDFIYAAEVHTELVVKLLRTKFCVTGPDYYEPGSVFRIYSKTIGILIAMLLVLFPIVHWIISSLSLYTTFLAHGLSLATVAYAAIVFILNSLAILIFVGTYKDFDFNLNFNRTPWINQ